MAPGWRVFGFMSLLTGLACVLFGLTPALRVTHTNPGETMKTGARGTSDGREGVMIRRGLVVLQVALSLVLVVGALLLGGTLRNLMTLDPGFVTSGVLVASLDLRHAGVPADRRIALADQMAGRPLGVINPLLYRLAAQHDPGIIDVQGQGNTFRLGHFTVRGFPAGPGYDLVTGLGTIDVAKFVPDLVRLARGGAA